MADYKSIKQAYMDEFEKLDEDRDGKLNRREIAALLRSVDVQPTWLELDHLFREMDTDITRDEFWLHATSWAPSHRSTLHELSDRFRHFDADGDGLITKVELLTLLNAVREEHKLDTQREMNTLFEETDKNGDGRISFHEFVEMMKEKDYA